LVWRETAVDCSDAAACGLSCPIVGGVPVLINERQSIFRLRDYQGQQVVSLGYSSKKRLVAFIRRWTPSITENRVSGGLYADLMTNLRALARPHKPRVLVVGAGDAGEGITALRAAPDIEVVETDVYFAGAIVAVADAHELPFADRTFDAVVFQAVLEHVVDPARCVDEGWRVLSEGGLVYAESPFMYPVHLGAYDFTRFSLLGHRRLFRQFHELRGGVVAGAGTALALAARAFLLSLSASSLYQSLVRMFCPFVLFWPKYFDRWTIAKPHASDFACTTYFFGRRVAAPRSDRDILDSYGTVS